MHPLVDALETRARALGIRPGPRFLTVSISGQQLACYEDGALRRTYVISTSLRPPLNRRDSNGTPRGLHLIDERIGSGRLPGTVFAGRADTGRRYDQLPAAEQARNLITSRILWLRGLEPGVNAGGDVDTHARHIYLHGTNHEERLGSPASGGCVQLSNRDVVDLFARVRVGDLVWIGD